jgi:oxygen-independent coproporphyrinogen-3 oxidase
MGKSQKLSLYFHIPFCLSKCYYCDFNSYAGLSWLIPQYVDTLEKEMQLYAKAIWQFEVKTIYFGGGTPSLLFRESISRILKTCSKVFNTSPNLEVTLETNPGTVEQSFLTELKESGVNRLSLGVQSFSDNELRLLGRIHSANEAREAFFMARQAGFENINMDLLYALPRQAIGNWQNNLVEAIKLNPDHFSLYPLTLEPGTPLANAVTSGSLPKPDADLAADMYLLALDKLAQEGYSHYEISNWALPGKLCHHNITYWKNEPYLGFGAGAHSHLDGYRWVNVSSPVEYVKHLASLKTKLSPRPYSNSPWVDNIENIDRDLEIAEAVILGLRLEDGVNLTDFAHRFGVELYSIYQQQQINELVELGLIAKNQHGIKLTTKGKLLGNEVFSRFLPESKG